MDMGPVEDVQPRVPVFLHAHSAPGSGEDDEGRQPLLTALRGGARSAWGSTPGFGSAQLWLCGHLESEAADGRLFPSLSLFLS